MATVFLNGGFFDSDQEPVPLSAFDAGLQHGVGLFETMLGGVMAEDPQQAWVLHLDEHLERLSVSAKALGLSDTLRSGPLGDAVLETVRRSGLARARVRLTVTGGDLNLLAVAKARSADAEGGEGGAGHGADAARPRAQDPTILIVAQPATAYPEAMIQRGVGVTIADARVNPLDPFAGHKTLNYWWRLRELQRAGSRNAAEALVFSVSNHLAGGCVSNAMVVKDGVLMTPIARGEEEEVGKAAWRAGAPGASAGAGPVLPSPVLPGVTRAALLHAAEGEGIEVRRRMLAIGDVLGADELLLTNSSWGVLPVVKVEAETVGAGAPGEVTRALAMAWARLVREAGEVGG